MSSTGRLTCCAALFACGISSNNPAIVKHMDDMGRSYKAAQAAADLSAFVAQYDKFASDTRQAAGEAYRGPAHLTSAWSDGMAALTAGLAKVDQAVAAGDLAGAKAALAELDALRKKYHIALGV